PDGAGPRHQLGMADRRQHGFVEGGARREIPHRDGDVVDHAVTPAFTSLKTMESIKAWKEASMMLGETPTVVQRSPLSSSLSISTRVTASVPALRMRTR